GIGWLLLTTYIFIRSIHTKPWLMVGWLWFLCTLVPMIGLVQEGRQTYACRYAYFSFIGLYLILAWGLHALFYRLDKPARNRLALASGLLVIALLVAGSVKQTGIWQNDIALARGFVAGGQPGTL